LINLNKINKIYNNLKNNFLVWIGVNPPKSCIIKPIEEIILMSKSAKDLLTDIVIDNHEEEFRIKETGDDSGSHLALYVPVNTDTSVIEEEIFKKIKKRVIIIETPEGYINTLMR
tara:strand:+ start:144 stop:488 length:345 start_codon:yes stop_codon:yes gene_type:complete